MNEIEQEKVKIFTGKTVIGETFKFLQQLIKKLIVVKKKTAGDLFFYLCHYPITLT